MFNIGDKIVYPSQGVGIINLIEERDFCGKKQNYCKINLVNKNLDILIPEDRLINSNIRLISDIETLDKLLNSLSDFSEKSDDISKSNSKERMISNTLKFKTGTLADFAGVICNLTRVNHDHPLNTSEKQMLKNTKQFLIDEICSVKDISTLEATTLLNKSIKQITF